jgi:hypothetical protein
MLKTFNLSCHHAVTISTCSYFWDVLYIKYAFNKLAALSTYTCDNPFAYTVLSGITKKGIEINKFHKMLGHCGSGRSDRTAKIHGFKLIGELKKCKECAISKARQKNVNKEWKGSNQIPGERLYIDISFIENASYNESKFWAHVVDDYTDYCWSIFVRSKDELKDRMITLSIDLKITGIEVKYVQCDNAGDNKAFYNYYCLTNELIKFKFSGPRTLQRNGKVERKFQTLQGVDSAKC